MRRWSLRLRLGLVLLGITALALFSAGVSLYVAETAHDDAAAINRAGSLRMQAYRIAALLHEGPASREVVTAAADEFERILADPALRGTVRGGAAPERRYRGVRRQWRESLRPGLTATGAEGDGGSAYLDRVDGFVDSVDAMVAALQHQAERRIRWLRVTQIATMLATVILALGAMYLMHSRVVRPLRDLMAAAERIRHGDFGARSATTGRDEIGVLGQSFNTMAADLETFHQGLERQVEHKTRELRRSNEALQLLYDAARTLTPGNLDERTVPPILERLERLVDAGPVRVRLTEPNGTAVRRTYSSRPDHAPASDGAEAGDADPDGDSPAVRNHSGRGAISVPLQHHGHHHGTLLVEHREEDVPLEWQRRLAEAVAEKIAATCDLEREARHQRRLALMEERTAIARELHDSLAQSLSYLKIQVTRLEAGLRHHPADAATHAVVAELRDGLNTAYGHLRELLTTFRLKMNEPGLQAALETAAEEFRQRPESPAIHLATLQHALPLDSNAEIHILHITREALANVVNHARARHCWIHLQPDDNGEVHLRIEDDGVGIPENRERPHHYGIRVMAERARSLGGEMTIELRPQGGTRVEVRFPARDGTGAEYLA
ncbi:HAMP domain-containing protein [Aquisalimonas lutea]|uniref:HAMP domain-containing protein n=1 Tax=Aquisalimonas lutea TaxID=1327750 RepID=UPI0025B5AB53|nr:HAMP domain-containing protein [Aquisalimonas lutea]MDN3519361.1 HAMP domain-containing protein [Aquisalimonas lutea]